MLEYSSKFEEEDDGAEEGEEGEDEATAMATDDAGAGPSGIQPEDEVLYVDDDAWLPILPPLVSSNATADGTAEE